LKLIRFLVIGLLWSLAACSNPVAATAPPTPRIVSLQLTTAVMGWKNDLTACASAQPQVGLIIQEAPLGQIDLTQADVLLRFAEPPTTLTAYSAILGWDEVVVITHPSYPTTQITRQALQAIYAGKATTWSDLQLPGLQGSEQARLPLQVWAFPPENDIRHVFDKVVLDGVKPTPHTYLAPDAAAMLEAIARTPGSIGYLLKSSLDLASGQKPAGQKNGGTPSSVQIVKPLTIADSLSGMKQPILAIAPSEPQGDLRQLLLCLQKKIG
jgi:hypothetical protein